MQHSNKKGGQKMESDYITAFVDSLPIEYEISTADTFASLANASEMVGTILRSECLSDEKRLEYIAVISDCVLLPLSDALCINNNVVINKESW